jgi:ribosomal protein L28
MSRVCSVCGKGPMSGNHVSHSNRKTKEVGALTFKKLSLLKKTAHFAMTMFAQGVCVVAR